jgi:uncharacterized repeat protein (TIGR01451 family)
MKTRRKALRTTGLCWSLLLGLGLALGLLLVLSPHHTAQAEGTGVLQQEPDLSIGKWTEGGCASPGGVFVYGIWYGNYLTDTADVTIVDTLPVSTTYAGDTSGVTPVQGAGVITWHLGNLSPEEWGGFKVTLNIDGDAPIGNGVIAQNCAYITTTASLYDANPDNNITCANALDTCSSDVDVDIDKWSEVNDPLPGEEFVYGVRWCNNRAAHVGPVWLTDTLPVSTTLLDWGGGDWVGDRYWTEVITTGGQVVLYAPGLSQRCQELWFRLLLDEDVAPGTQLQNHAVITATGDVDPDNNERTQENWVGGGSRYDMAVEKNWGGGALAPGGWVGYNIRYDNRGNTAVRAWLTDTLPSGTSFSGASHEGEPFTPTVTGAGYVAWDLGLVGVADGDNIDIELAINSSVTPSTIINNCASVGITQTEDTPWDNTSCVATTVYSAGMPNLGVYKVARDYQPGNSEIEYRLFFGNSGDQTVSNVSLTDTFPLSMTLNGYNVQNWDQSRYTVTQSATDLVIDFDQLESGERGEIQINFTLDEPDEPFRTYTNTAEIDTPSNDADPSDNTHAAVVSSGNEVRQAEIWIGTNGRSDMWGQALESVPVTVTTPSDQFTTTSGNGECSTCWNIDEGVGIINPGDIITVEAGSGAVPVIMEIPDPFVAYASSVTDTVWGQVGGWANDFVEIHGDWPAGYKEAPTDGSGSFSRSYFDVPRGAEGYIRFENQSNYATLVYHRQFKTSDLLMRVNYGHDWVEGEYEAGYTVVITATESDRTTVKGTAVLTTGAVPWWGPGEIGFSTNWQGWSYEPDLQPGDWVFGLVAENGYTSSVRIGTIDGNVSVDTDSISGTITANWFTQMLSARCGVQEDGAPGFDFTVDPNGGSYECDFSGSWDLLPGQGVGVEYQEPDGDWVVNVFREPGPNMEVEKWTEGGGQAPAGGPVVFTIRYRNNGDGVAQTVLLTDTLPMSTTYVSDSSGFSVTDNGDTVSWSFGPVNPNEGGQFQIVLTNTANDGDTLVNQVDIYTLYDNEDGNNHAETQIDVVSGEQPDLYVDKGVNPGDPYPGETFLYEINYGNNGPVASGPVTLTDTLPEGTTVDSWYSEQNYTLWTDASTGDDELVLEAPTIPGGWSDRIYLRLVLTDTVSGGTQLTNTVAITTSNDSDSGNNWMQNTDAWVTDDQRWDAGISKDFNWGTLIPGGEVAYHVHTRNEGNVATQVWITDTLPAGATFVTSTHWTGVTEEPVPPAYIGGGVVAWNLGVMEPAEDFGIDIRLTVNSAAGTTITNCATANIAAEDSWPYNDTDCVVDTVRQIGTNLRVYKRVEWQGQDQIRYEISFENIGTVNLSNVLITDTYPVSTTYSGNWWADFHREINEEAQYPAQNQVVFRVGEIQTGESGRINLVVALDGGIAGTHGLIFTNTVEAPISGDIYTADNYYEKVAFTGPDIYVEKWLSGGELRAGKIVTFTVKFGNRNLWPWNADSSYGTYITDTLPAGMTFITATAPWDPNQSWTPSELPGNVFEWSAGTMWNDSAWYFDVVVQITATATAGDVLTNTIEIQGQSPTDVEPYYDNNVFELPVTIADKFSTVTTLDSSLNPSEPGESVTFTATVTSTGDTPIGSVMFYDNGALLGTRTLDGSGTASYTTSALTAGTHPITATYGGGVSFEVSTSNMISQVVNTPPVATSDAYTMTVNTTLTVTAPGVLTNDTDADSQPLTAVLDTDVLTGTLDIHADGSFVYTPPQDYTGVVTFTYHVTDGYVDSNTVQVTITIQDFTIYLPLVLRNY